MSKQINLLATAVIVAALAGVGCSDKSADQSIPAPTVSSESTPAVAANTDASKTNAAAQDAAVRYDGKVVRQPPGAGGKAEGWYLVKDGKRRWIVRADWLPQNGLTPESVIEISSEEFNAIPEDPMPLGE